MSASDPQSLSTSSNVALGVCGGIAAYKAVEVLRGLQKAGCDVRVAMTKRACEFIQPLTFRALSGSHVIVDDYAPDNPDPIAHITFSQSVDLLLVAPATANIIAKFANGIADDFLTSTYLASTAPVLIAPAMNTTMWHHPATQRNVQKLREDGVRFIEPDEGEMACGTIGPGRLSEPDRIVARALEILGSHSTDADMEAHAAREARDATIFIGAAAVSDYRPQKISNSKIKKSLSRLEVTFERTPDILAQVSQRRREGQIIVGFAAETENLIHYA